VPDSRPVAGATPNLGGSAGRWLQTACHFPHDSQLCVPYPGPRALPLLQVSRISSKGFWLAGLLGVVTAATLMLGGPAIIDSECCAQ